MNIKTMAAIVGTLSLGALATGCATAKPATAATEEKGSEASCKGDAAATQEKGGEAQCGGDKASSTSEKGSEHACGKDGCGAAKPQ
ncbi:hypothetical protein JQX13_33610 [Archangium violaceum]|uniref:hypothetical protein n=1 Tax=Archangium violaceum TaxID=83451 RepID=UPI00193B7070|nr:hypothetical protein [Archangium violaceum]QRK05116.1 hypothetical protein JQX13_33610 [Archangium violaceum]